MIEFCHFLVDVLVDMSSTSAEGVEPSAVVTENTTSTEETKTEESAPSVSVEAVATQTVEPTASEATPPVTRSKSTPRTGKRKRSSNAQRPSKPKVPTVDLGKEVVVEVLQRLGSDSTATVGEMKLLLEILAHLDVSIEILKVSSSPLLALFLNGLNRRQKQALCSET